MKSARFGTSGIRGVYEEQIDPIFFARLGQATARTLGGGIYTAGHDTRRPSPALALSLSSALSSVGSGVLFLGTVPTPVVAFAIVEGGLKGGFSVTASHNPPEYVGVKVFDHRAIPVSRQAEEEIEALLYQQPGSAGDRFGEIRDADFLTPYIRKMVKALPSSGRRMTVLVDCINGAASEVTPRILEALGHRVIGINCHPSWRFTPRKIEPAEENLKDTASLVRTLGADVGIAHDGDADRAVMIDPEGKVMTDHTFSAVMLKIVLERNVGGVVLSINTSNACREIAERFGAWVQTARLGKTFEDLYNMKGVFATEPSKVVDSSWGYWEDGIYAACLLIQTLSQRGEDLGSLLKDIPRYHSRQVNLLLTKEIDPSFSDRIAAHYRGKGCQIQLLDGVKAIFADGSWILFRRSGTEPKVRVYGESKTEEGLRKLMDEGLSLPEMASSQDKP